jgi:hypothetical protein
MKMRNQNNLGWCYAHAASDYLQFTYNLPEQVSAADIAINYSKSKWSRFLTFFTHLFDRELRQEPPQTGLIKYAVQMILPQGYCPESALPSGEWTRVDQNNQRSQQEILQSVLDSYDFQKKIQSEKIKTADELPWFFEFKNINRDQYFSILKKSNHNALLENIRQAACKNERIPFPHREQVGIDFQLRTNRVFQNMNASFDRGSPVTIDFFSDVLKHYDSPKRNFSTMHTVLLYGRKYDQQAKECVYMIKNSYGDDCRHAGSNGLPYDPKIVCEGGNVWLPESKMFRAMTSQLILHR